MKTLFIAVMLSASIASGDDILTESDQLSPRDLNMFKWEFRQKTDSTTGAIMRVERTICGVLVEQYEDVIYSPEKDLLGSLLVFSAETPIRIVLPGGNQIKPDLDKMMGNIATGTESIKGVDGIERNSTFVRFQGDHETIRIFFYKAPFSIYRKEMQDMPSTTDGKLSLFRWRYETMDMQYTTLVENVNDQKKVSLIQGPNKAKHATPR